MSSAAAPALSTAAKIATAVDYKDKGNALFRAGEFKSAVKQYRFAFLYSKGLIAVDDASMAMYVNEDDKLSRGQTDSVKDLNRTIYSNLSACYLKMGAFDRALENANHALQIKKDDPKSLLRKGQACIALKEWKWAKDALTAALEIEPHNSAIISALKDWKNQYAQWTQDQKQKEIETFGGKLL